MTIEEKKKRAFISIHRGMQPVKFVRDYLSKEENIKDLDEPRLRSHYMLLSFGFELILKSRVIMLSQASDKIELHEELSKKIGHDFTEIESTLGEYELEKIGIERVKLIKAKCNDSKNPDDEYSNFIIKTTTDEIVIENFTDIRYGCMGGGVRTVSRNEHKKILEYVKLVLEVCEKVRVANEATTPIKTVGRDT